jgi:hypothetical protein
MTLEFILSHDVINKQEQHHKLIKHCLHAMARGGMYDVVGGGFSRYSTDNFWRIPHSEKLAQCDNKAIWRENPYPKPIQQTYTVRKLVPKPGTIHPNTILGFATCFIIISPVAIADAIQTQRRKKNEQLHHKHLKGTASIFDPHHPHPTWTADCRIDRSQQADNTHPRSQMGLGIGDPLC